MIACIINTVKWIETENEKLKDTNWSRACFQQPPPAWFITYEIKSWKLCGIGKQKVRLTFCSSPAVQKSIESRCYSRMEQLYQLSNAMTQINEMPKRTNWNPTTSYLKKKSRELCLVWNKKCGTCKWNKTCLMKKSNDKKVDRWYSQDNEQNTSIRWS